MYGKTPQLSIFACTDQLAARQYKSQLFEVVSLYPSRSAVYNAIGGGLEAVEFTLWKWEWLAENCVRAHVGLALELAELSY